MTKPKRTPIPDDLHDAHLAVAELVGDQRRLTALLDASTARLTEARRSGDDDALADAAKTVAGLREALNEVADAHAAAAAVATDLEAAHAAAEAEVERLRLAEVADRATEAAFEAVDAFLDDTLAALAAFRDAIASANTARAAANRGQMFPVSLVQAASDFGDRSLAHTLGTLAAHRPSRRNGGLLTAMERRQAEADRIAKGHAAKVSTSLAFLRGLVAQQVERIVAHGGTSADRTALEHNVARIRDEHGTAALAGLRLPAGLTLPPAVDPPRSNP